MLNPYVGKPVLYRADSSRTVPATITKINSGDNVNLVAVADDDSGWPVTTIPSDTHPAELRLAVDKGASSEQWADLPIVDIAVSTPARVIDDPPFQPSTTNVVRVAYSVRVIAGASDLGHVALLSDASATPSTVRARVGAGAGTVEAVLAYHVPRGHYVQLVHVDETNTVTSAITAQVEELFG